MPEKAAPEFSLGSYRADDGNAFDALAIDRRLIPLAVLARDPNVGLPGGSTSVLALLRRWDESLPRLRRAAELYASGDPFVTAAALDASGCLPCAPFTPGRIFGTGINYRSLAGRLASANPTVLGATEEGADIDEAVRAHLDEQARIGKPFCFVKLPSSLTGPTGNIIVPPTVRKLECELELAVVIGRRADRVAACDAMDCVAGFTIINDLTARDMLFPKGGTGPADWLAAKSRPTFAPFGPYFLPAEFVSDPYRLGISLSVNGKLVQDGSTSDMLIGIDRQIEWLSHLLPLLPGDVIATGSPASIDANQDFAIRPGDVVEGSIEGLGSQRNVCVAPEDISQKEVRNDVSAAP
jgi:2,4-diketo-3-deoxy-L-fuconate hydrolase